MTLKELPRVLRQTGFSMASPDQLQGTGVFNGIREFASGEAIVFEDNFSDGTLQI